MKLFEGKKGVVMGVANKHSIATTCAQYFNDQGAELAFSHLPDLDGKGKMKKRVLDAISHTDPALVEPCDVTSDESITTFFTKIQQKFGKIDFLIHSIAFAPLDDIRVQTVGASRSGFLEAMNVSVYSLIAVTRAAQEILNPGGSITTMTYFGGEKVVAGYNLMGICKAALDRAVTYLAYDLGPKELRVNAVSCGPVKTLASSAIGSFSKMAEVSASIAPMGRKVTTLEAAKATAYLASDLASGTTGEILHVDCGYNIMGSPGYAFDRLGITDQKPKNV